MRISLAVFVVGGVLVACGGAEPNAAPVARAPACAVPVTFGNQSAYTTSALEPNALASARSALHDARACDRPLKLAFALGATEDDGSAVRAELHVSVLSASDALVATSSVTVRMPKPVSETDVASAVGRAAAVLAKKVTAEVR
ncbi:hypothetical protein BH09MYX1_BH09MYX1_16400 [soil metagenome]